jgi:hypothetical protein
MIYHYEATRIWTGIRFGYAEGIIRAIGEFRPGDTVIDIFTHERYLVGDTDNEGTLITHLGPGRQIYHYVIGPEGVYVSAPFYVETSRRINPTADRRYMLVAPAQIVTQPAQMEMFA